MKTILVGFDAFSPQVFEKLHEEGKMPNLGKLVKRKGYERFTVSNPAQSEVSWTSIATGLNPGGHGLFDFVHRNPKNYSIYVSLLPTGKGMLGLQFVQPYEAQTIFDYAVDKGYPASALWWPAMFPARQGSPVNVIPGLGTPDILGRLGSNYYYTPDKGNYDQDTLKTQILELKKSGNKNYSGSFFGPMRKQGNEMAPAEVPFEFEMLDGNVARLKVGKQTLELKIEEWSPIIEIPFKLNMLISVVGLTRVMIKNREGEIGLYALPLQLHPLKAAWPSMAPRNFAKQVWQQNGPFLTLGWPQDTTGLEEGFISDEQFLALCDSILEDRERVFMSKMGTFDEGLLGIVFDTLDRVQHMFWKDRPDVIEEWYLKLDALYGRIADAMIPIGDDTRMVVLSDHGFAPFEYKAHLNRFLQQEGYLATKDNATTASLDDVDWSNTQAYAIGLNSLYLNIEGREGQGAVKPDQIPAVADKLKSSLLNWKGPDGKAVLQNVYLGSEAFEGPLVTEAPDMAMGYTPGYRASADTGLGKWDDEAIQKNTDHWNSDHCMDPAQVQGVLFCNHGLNDFPAPSYKDIPPLAIGVELEAKDPPARRQLSDEDQKEVEERLKGLGYL